MRRTPILPLRRLLSALLCSVPFLVQAEAPPAPVDLWLGRMAQSTAEMNYRGVLSYSRDGHLESLRITHGTVNGQSFERLEHLDGERREIIRRGKQVTCIQLDQRFNLLFNRRLLGDGLAGLDRYYEIAPGGDDRVAGRSAVTILIKPRDGFRYGYRLALDRETGLPLRSEVLDAAGKTLERLQFVEVEIGQPLKKEWLAEPGAAATTASLRESVDGASIPRVVEEVQMPWRPQWLPPGFVLAVAPHQPGEGVLTYSDGLAVLSVFVEPAKAPQPNGAGKAVQGATIAYTRSAQFGDNPAAVTVVGEVPAITASRVAESVTWGGGN